MDTMSRDLDFNLAYFDDILIVSPKAELHKKHIVTVRDRLEQYGAFLM